MSHYKSNLRDIEFNLFEVNRIQDHGHHTWEGLDRETMTDILREVERLASEDYAASYEDQDRIPLELVDGEVVLPDSVKASVAAFNDGDWGRFGLPEAMGGMEVPPSLVWAVSEMLRAASTTSPARSTSHPSRCR